MLSGNYTKALSIQANVTISCSSAKLIKNGISPLPFPLPALLKRCPYIKRGERVRVRGHAPFYATLGFMCRSAHGRRWSAECAHIDLHLASGPFSVASATRDGRHRVIEKVTAASFPCGKTRSSASSRQNTRGTDDKSSSRHLAQL